LLCTGKIYYELNQRRTELQRNDIAIVRLEQLYPLPNAELQQALAVYREGTLVVWVQEEPENMGAWRYLRIQFLERLLDRFPFRGVYRPAAASPATGSYSSHKKEQETLLNQAFDV
jgi:2-oxoglutarate dehydrogenase E1 component